jgi:hypothetical protein
MKKTGKQVFLSVKQHLFFVDFFPTDNPLIPHTKAPGQNSNAVLPHQGTSAAVKPRAILCGFVSLCENILEKIQIIPHTKVPKHQGTSAADKSCAVRCASASLCEDIRNSEQLYYRSQIIADKLCNIFSRSLMYSFRS